MSGFRHPIDLDQVRRSAAVIEGVAHRTPVVSSRTLDERTGASVVIKAENLQRAGAFKFRGAYNALRALTRGASGRGWWRSRPATTPRPSRSRRGCWQRGRRS